MENFPFKIVAKIKNPPFFSNCSIYMQYHFSLSKLNGKQNKTKNYKKCKFSSILAATHTFFYDHVHINLLGEHKNV